MKLHSNDIFAALHYNRTVTVSSLREINNIRAHVHTLLNSLEDMTFEIDKMESSEHYTTIYLSKPTHSPSLTGYSPFGTVSISPNPYNDNSLLIPTHPYLTRTYPTPTTPNYNLTIDLLVPLEAPQDEIDAYNTLIDSLTLYPSATLNA